MIKLSSPGQFWEIPVLFEDEHLLALEKPGGMLTAPDRENPTRPALIKLLHDAIKAGKPWAVQRNLAYLMYGHRLDPETSGVLLLAKTKPVLVALANLFGSEKPLLRHVALIRGQPAENQFTVDAKIGPQGGRPGVMRVDTRNGKRAVTTFEVLEKFRDYALLKCEARIARLHQTRVHLRHAGFPVVGDDVYGGRPLLLSRLKPKYHLKENAIERPLLASAAIHLEQLSLPHPISGEPLVITAPWPKDLTVALKYLRRYGGV